ncbi:acyl-CoA thioesterase [Puniceicoccaceae bacterium K14]|nr:acyl-CoA thioesterase [Puniceicoccaceae bacterium K14]
MMSANDTFRTNIKVTVGDLNYGNHVGNDRFLLFFHEARIRFLQNSGLSEMDIGEGVSLIMSEAQLKYKAQIGLGEELGVEVKICDVGRVRFVMEYSVLKKSDQVVAATGKTVMGAFDYEANKITMLPASFIERFS